MAPAPCGGCWGDERSIAGRARCVNPSIRLALASGGRGVPGPLRGLLDLDDPPVPHLNLRVPAVRLRVVGAFDAGRAVPDAAVPEHVVRLEDRHGRARCHGVLQGLLRLEVGGGVGHF